jgi:UDP-4-amino-4,6-dideoxy-N-acetyl-beta-L-altrosamine N-acetyltransferase
MGDAFIQLTFRQLQDEDKWRIYNWRVQPDVDRYMCTSHVISANEHERWWSRIPDDRTRAYWIIEANGLPIGLVNLYDIATEHKRCSWGIYLAMPSYRGRGIGQAVAAWIQHHVFVERGFQKLCCEVLATNERAIGMYRRAGFVVEGTLRNHIIKAGQAMDLVLMAVERVDGSNF